MEPERLQPRIQSQLLLMLIGLSLTESPKARGAGSSERLCYLWPLSMRFESLVCKTCFSVQLCLTWICFYKLLILSNGKRDEYCPLRLCDFHLFHISSAFMTLLMVLFCIFSHRQTPVQARACAVPLPLRRWHLPPQKWHAWRHIQGRLI